MADTEREAFEAMIVPAWSRETYVDGDGDVQYVEDWMQGAWMGWSMARAALASRPAAENMVLGKQPEIATETAETRMDTGFHDAGQIASRPAEVDDIPPRVTPGMVNGLAEAYERLEASQERMAKLKEKYLSPKPPRTPEEMVAFIGSHFDAMRDETSDPEDIRFTLSVHDLLSAMSDWFDDYAESAYSNEKSAEVEDEGLPPLKTPEFCAGDLEIGEPVYTAEQYRQGQRDAVAAYKRQQVALQQLADQAQENDMGY